MLDIDAIEAAITPKTAAIIINTPNNPVGSVYSDENLTQLADLLRAKSAEYGHTIYLISDEPYRELVYDGLTPAWVPSLYDATFVCYSWSKSFSLPGERIGYLLVPDSMPNFDRVYKAVCGAGRSLGYICDSVLFQLAVAECIDAPIDVEPYDRNRKLLYDGLTSIGYNVIYPQGAFYMWIEALEPMRRRFARSAASTSYCSCRATAFSRRAGRASATAATRPRSRRPQGLRGRLRRIPRVTP